MTEPVIKTMGVWSWRSDLLWSKVEQADPNACWRYLGSTSPHANLFGAKKNGRPQMTQAARLLWMDLHNESVENLEVAHNCGNRFCCNPRHMFTRPNHMRFHRDGAVLGTYEKRSVPVKTVAGRRVEHWWVE